MSAEQTDVLRVLLAAVMKCETRGLPVMVVVGGGDASCGFDIGTNLASGPIRNLFLADALAYALRAGIEGGGVTLDEIRIGKGGVS